MRCPHCAAHILERWQPLITLTNALGSKLSRPRTEIPNQSLDDEGSSESLHVVASWMECPNGECRGIIIAIEEKLVDDESEDADEEGVITQDSWFAYPKRRGDRPVDANVPERMAKDYREAAAILPDSPKASAAIARRILADILEQFGKYDGFRLSSRLEAFAADAKHPVALRENARYLVELGDFAAHTQKDTVTQEIVDVEPGEAEWTLDVIDGMFDYFIIGPARDRSRRSAVDAKLQATGRKPIPKPD